MKAKILALFSILFLAQSSFIVYQNTESIVSTFKSPAIQDEQTRVESVNAVSLYKTQFVGSISTYGKIKSSNYSNLRVPYFQGFTVFVENVCFQAGDKVSKGDVLIRFQCDELKCRLQAVQSEYSQAKLYYDKLHKLSSGNVSEFDLEKSKLTLVKNEAELNALKIKCNSLEFRAPFNGRMGSSDVVAGEEISSNQHISAIVGDSEYVVTFYVDHSLSSILHRGKKVIVESINGDMLVDGMITGVSPYLEDEVSRLKVTATLSRLSPNNKSFMHNASVNVTLEKEPLPNVYVIPRSSIMEIGNTYRVCKIVKRGHLDEIKIVRVMLLGTRGDKCAVSGELLYEGEYIVVEGGIGLSRDGSIVTIKNIYG